MFSREIQNDYGSYSSKDSTTILLKGIFDKNFIELKTINPTDESYKVFSSPSHSINFAVKIGTSTYIPQHLFDRLKTAYEENNPYYTVNDLITIELDLSKTLSYLQSKYGSKIETSNVEYVGVAVDVTSSILESTASIIQVNANYTQGASTRFGLAGVTDIQFQFYKNNKSNDFNDENIIKHILYLFEETNTPSNGWYKNLQYQLSNGSVILPNLPASTDVVKPAVQKVSNLDDYLRDVKRT